MLKKFLIEEMAPQEITEALKETETVIVPLGTMEQHATHLPVGTDVIIPITVAKRVAEKTKVLVAPPIYYGNSLSMADLKMSLAAPASEYHVPAHSPAGNPA